jgi:hypothetical protein
MRQGPGEYARLRLLKVPAERLLGLMVMPTKWRQVALTSPAAEVVRRGVIVVASGRRSATAGKPAGLLADGDQVAQPARGPISGSLTLVGALPRFQRHRPKCTEPASHMSSTRRPRTVPSAGVRHCTAVPVGQGEAPSASRMRGQPSGQTATGVGVGGTEAGNLSGRFRDAKPGGQRHGQIHVSGDRRPATLTVGASCVRRSR